MDAWEGGTQRPSAASSCGNGPQQAVAGARDKQVAVQGHHRIDALGMPFELVVVVVIFAVLEK